MALSENSLNSFKRILYIFGVHCNRFDSRTSLFFFLFFFQAQLFLNSISNKKHYHLHCSLLKAVKKMFYPNTFSLKAVFSSLNMDLMLLLVRIWRNKKSLRSWQESMRWDILWIFWWFWGLNFLVAFPIFPLFFSVHEPSHCTFILAMWQLRMSHLL